MQPIHPSAVVGVFINRQEAEAAMDELHRAGFTHEHLGFVMRGDDERRTRIEAETGPSTGEGALGGVLAGAGVGAMIAAAASLLVPGVGPVLAGGILVASLGGAAVGAAAGGVLGGLIAVGVPEEEAKYYESEFNEGRLLVTVRADGRANEAGAILHHHGAMDRTSRPVA
jgi:hypothetical protein